MEIPTVSLLVAVALILGIVLDRYLLHRVGARKLVEASRTAEQIIREARNESDRLARESLESAEKQLAAGLEELELRNRDNERALLRARRKADKRAAKLNRRLQRLASRERALQLGLDAIDELRIASDQVRRDIEKMQDDAEHLLAEVASREGRLAEHEEAAAELKRQVAARDRELAHLIDEQIRKLEQVSGLTRSAARDELVQHIVDEARTEAASLVKTIRDEARTKAGTEARKLVLNAIQRTAASHTIENTVSVVNLQSDEMKGRIIGREGRNIRAFEAATGIEVIVDDTPEAVILSGFNPVRREVARLALNRLVQDGRIHPARIEEVVDSTAAEIDQEIIETGQRTVIDLDLHAIHPELMKLVGRMRYRTSYGQNLLSHSIETARIASLLAAEAGLKAGLARRAGLLHDVGKVYEDDLETPHALLGMELCERYEEDAIICNAVGAHHDETEMTSMIAPIVQAADAISGARPGARREALEAYIKRLAKLERLASSFEGVERVFAIQAGREIRVIVNHELVSDSNAEMLAIDISRTIEKEMQYPGQVKVTVIREVRSVSYAK
jgi:ribonuclease Y